LGEAIRYPQSHGDVWTTTWADDGALHSVSDDTWGFDRACRSNLAVHRVTGDLPPDIRGETINCMGEFGGLAEFLPEDDGMWKANGLTCLDGVLYLSVSRHGDPSRRPFFVQETWDASIVISRDYGRTWSPTPHLGHSMFPGHTFSTPFFVQYGQDGRGEADGADTYVYAASSNGVWNNGSSMTLGRVRRDRIAQLDPRDWEFVHGYDERGQPIWRPRQDSAAYTFRAPGRTSMTGIHFIAPLGLYIMPQWQYLYLDDQEREHRWASTRLEFYQAPAPWGPWSLFHAQDFEPQGWYNPCIPGKFISADGRTMWVFVAGDFTTSGTSDGYYGLFMMPMTLDVR
jgi:hypothetical protein